MVTKFLILSFLVLGTTNLYAQAFVMSLHADHDYTTIHSRSSFHLFSDGKYSIETNTGILGVCTSSEVGKFVGQVKPAVVTEIKKFLADTDSKCKGLGESSCTTDEKSKDASVSWWMSDLSGDVKKTYYFKSDEKTPASIRKILEKVAGLQNKRTVGLTLTKKSDGVYALNYKGKDHLQLPISLKNFMLVREGGAVLFLGDVFSDLKLEDKVAKLHPGESEIVKLNFKIPKEARNWRLIYDSSSGDNPVGHSDIQLSPCLFL